MKQKKKKGSSVLDIVCVSVWKSESKKELISDRRMDNKTNKKLISNGSSYHKEKEMEGI